MSTIRFSNSNNVMFLRVEDQTLKQSDTTRLNFAFDYWELVNPCYYTKVLQSDNIWVQYRTDYDGVRAYIINTAGTEVELTTNIAKGAELSDNRFQYELFLDLTGYSGKYYFRFDFDQDTDKPVATYQSQWFEVATSFPYHDFIEWKNNEFNPFDDGIIWGGITQKLWVQSRISDTIIGVEKSVFTASNYKLKTTQAQPIKSKSWVLELLPDYMIESLNIFMQHDYFYINGVRYNSDGTFEDSERQGNTRLYNGQISLRVVEDAQGNAYEDYSTDQTITGTLPVIPPFALYAGVGKALFAGTGKAIGYK
jgi:hypothetical protein